MMEPDAPNAPDLSDPIEADASASPTTHREDTGTQALTPSTTPLLPPTGIHDEERQTLLATLAASRDLGPEMDHALADHYFEQRALSQSRALRRQQRMPRSFGQRVRQGVQRLRETGLLWPILIGAVALVGIGGATAITVFAALHGFPLDHHGPPGAGSHGSGDFGSGANAHNSQSSDGPDPDGFFPFFGGFPWIIPVVLLFIFLRRRALSRRAQRYQGQLSQGNQAYLPTGYQTPSAPESGQATTPRATYTSYQPYNPFGGSTGATHTLPTADGAGAQTAPSGEVTNEVSPPPTTKPLSNPAG